MSHHRAAETLGARARATGVQALGASLAGPSGEKGCSPGSQHQPTRAFGSPPGPAFFVAAEVLWMRHLGAERERPFPVTA
jgi:hypothetical protein